MARRVRCFTIPAFNEKVGWSSAVLIEVANTNNRVPIHDRHC